MTRKRTRTAPHPGELLQQWMRKEDVTAYRVSVDTGIGASSIGKILGGTLGITARVALRLARYFGTSPELWLAAQMQHELQKAEEESADDIQKVVPLH